MGKQVSSDKIAKASLLYNSGASYKEIAQVLGVDPKNVARTLRTGGCQITRRNHPSHPVDEHFFDHWTQESAYVLGFFYADGSLTTHHTARFFSADLDLLEQIRDEMGVERTIGGPYSGVYHLSINSRLICNHLRELVHGSKVGRIIYPDVPLEVERDFLRGFFDGDGHVGKRPRRGAPTVNFSNTSLTFMEGLVEALSRHGIRNQTVKLAYNPSIPNHRPGYVIEFRNWKLFHRIAALFYGHNPTLYLNRKRERFLKYWPSNTQPALFHIAH